MLLAAALLSLASGSRTDFWTIIVLFFSNFAIGLWHERKADRSIAELEKHLARKALAMRDGSWTLIDAAEIVEGDLVRLSVGDLVPADARIVSAKNLSLNESSLTGESLPKEKRAGDTAYSGSFVTTGEAEASVTATGGRTYFGKTVVSIDASPRRSALEKDILSISRFISLVSIGVMIILSAVLVLAHASALSIATLDLSLLIAGIPVALPTVMSLIISIGVVALAGRQVVVRRLASLEDLANVDLLLSDKTGTLTSNVIKVERIEPEEGFSETELVSLAVSAVEGNGTSPIDAAIMRRAAELGASAYARSDYTPGDSERKRSTAVIELLGARATISLGAPRVVAGLCTLGPEAQVDLERRLKQAASDGYRALAVALNKNGILEEGMCLVGLLYLADTLLPDARPTIDFMCEQGISVKMLTGDSLEISRRIGDSLGLKGEIVDRSIFDRPDELSERFESIGGFAEVLPADKRAAVIVGRARHTVAVTGDGVNDLPAVKEADVGFAVSDAVEALKSAADIVLLTSGVAVIKDAIIEARKIFVRLYDYSLYRISESFRIIITIAVIGFIYKAYPLTPVELIVLAFLNDVPIISLAFDRVKASEQPAHIDAKRRFALSTLFGLAGTANSLILLLIMVKWLHLPWAIIQTVFFLKLTVSGHMLVYVAHTREVWYKYLPSKQVILATIGTQLVATGLALGGFLVAPISVGLVVLVWVWSFLWMQVSELAKHQKLIGV
jgi:H+-transporting ATPase